MNSRFTEALSPLAARMPRAIRDMEILRVAAQLDGEDFEEATDTARRAVLRWAKRRAGGHLPQEAGDLEDFELTRGGRNSTAVRLRPEGVDLWALRAEDPDKDVAGRVWATEVVVGGKIEDRPFFCLRLITSTNETDFRIEPHVPGPVLQLVDAPGLVIGGRELLSIPRLIETKRSAEDLCDHLEDPARRLPIIVVTISEGVSSGTMIDDTVLAKATAGLARVVRLSSELTWILTSRFGRYRSVFGGAVRIYVPGFSSVDDPYRHRLFLAEHLVSEEDSVVCVAWLRKAVADYSVAHTRLGRDVLDFSAVRTESRRFRASSMRDTAASDTDLLETANALIESLEQQVEEKNKEIDIYVEEVEVAEARAEASENQNRVLLYQVRQLKDALDGGGDAPTAEPPLPQAWPEFLDWIDQTYPDRVVLTPAARRMVRSPEFEDVTCVAQSIVWLATKYRECRVEGRGGTLRDAPVIDGVRNAPCGGDTYDTYWNGRKCEVDWHIKSGGSTRDPKRCLRIYYFWEPDTERAVIDHLPSHRRTGMT